MSLQPTLQMLTRYSAWANARLFATLTTLPPATLTASRSEGAGSILKVLNHARVVDCIWKAHLQGSEHGFTSRNTEVLPALQDLIGQQQALDAWYVACADRLNAASAAEVLAFNFVDGGSGAMTRSEMLLHIVNHKTYHRGYVAEMLYQADLRPPVMDLPVFLRDAGPDQPAAAGAAPPR